MYVSHFSIKINRLHEVFDNKEQLIKRFWYTRNSPRWGDTIEKYSEISVGTWDDSDRPLPNKSGVSRNHPLASNNRHLPSLLICALNQSRGVQPGNIPPIKGGALTNQLHAKCSINLKLQIAFYRPLSVSR